MSDVTQEERDEAARDFLDDPDAESSAYDDCAYGLAGDWLILTDEEADHFVEDAISSDGRGHFLSSWDGSEHEFTHGGRDWYAYRT